MLLPRSVFRIPRDRAPVQKVMPVVTCGWTLLLSRIAFFAVKRVPAHKSLLVLPPRYGRCQEAPDSLATDASLIPSVDSR